MAVGEHEVLSLAVNLPVFRNRRVSRAAHAILRIVILVGIQRIELHSGAVVFGSRRVAAQHKGRGKLNGGNFDGSEMTLRRVARGSDERRIAAVEGGQQPDSNSLAGSHGGFLDSAD